jgi:hypothetical protein
MDTMLFDEGIFFKKKKKKTRKNNLTMMNIDYTLSIKNFIWPRMSQIGGCFFR